MGGRADAVGASNGCERGGRSIEEEDTLVDAEPLVLCLLIPLD